jgi:hypothetical protein
LTDVFEVGRVRDAQHARSVSDHAHVKDEAVLLHGVLERLRQRQPLGFGKRAIQYPVAVEPASATHNAHRRGRQPDGVRKRVQSGERLSSRVVEAGLHVDVDEQRPEEARVLG